MTSKQFDKLIEYIDDAIYECVRECGSTNKLQTYQELKELLVQEPRLKTIEEHNQFKRDQYFQKNQPQKTGIECPQCHNELLYADNMILTSYPPQRRVFCDKCNYSNTIVC